MEQRGVRLAEQVLDRLRDDIVRGVLPPGTPVIEADVSERLQVSRTPVREALIKLTEEGLVRVYPQRGSFVAPIQIEAVREAQFVREHLECAVIGEAAERMTPAWLSRLQDNVEQLKRAAQQADADQLFSLDDAFHALIADCAGMAGVWRTILQAKTHLDRVRRQSVLDQGDMERMLAEHQAVLAALETRDAAKAAAAMREHLRAIFRIVERLSLRHFSATEWRPARPVRTEKRRRATAGGGTGPSE